MGSPTWFHIGDRICIEGKFTDAAGDPVNPDAGVIFQLEKPDGTQLVFRSSESPPEILNPATGTFQLLYVVDSDRRWFWRYESGDDVTQADQGSFQVHPNRFTYPVPDP